MRMVIPTGRRSRSAVIVGPTGAFFFGIASLFAWTIYIVIGFFALVFITAYRGGVWLDTWWRRRKGLDPRSWTPRHARSFR